MTEGALGPGPLRAGSPLRTPRAAAVAGIIFSALMITALVLLRVSAPAHSADAGAWLTDPHRRAGVAIALNLVPFAGIAFLWFIGVLRDRIGEREDRFFATVFFGSGLLFVAMLFVAAAVSGGLIANASSEPAGWEHPGAGPQHHLQPAERLRDADGGGVHAHHGDHRPAHRDRVPVAHAGRAGLCAGAAGRRRDLAMGGAAVPRVDPGAEPGHPGGWPAGLVTRGAEPGNEGSARSALGVAAALDDLSLAQDDDLVDLIKPVGRRG